MNLYIDKENIESLISSRNQERYDDCLKTMRKQLNVFFNFKKEDIMASESMMAWYKLFTQGVGPSNPIKFVEEKIPSRPLKSNTHTTLSNQQLSSIFLVHDEKVETCISSGAILISQPGKEIETLTKLFLNQEDYSFNKGFVIGSDIFSKWSDLDSYSFPVSDVIIVDSYILSDSSLIDSNLIPLLKTLTLRSRCKVNIIIYTNTSNITITYESLREKVKSAINSTTGISPNFTLIKYHDQRGRDSFAEHDRTIFTNYNRLYSGDTFNYFLSNGEKTTKGRELHLFNFGKMENHTLASTLIIDIQSRIANMSPDSILGDKKSNFLNFQ